MRARGFTLIELLVVISIISLLSSVVLASLNSARAKARDTQRTAQVREIQNALDLYYSDYGSYPLSYHQLTLPAGCADYNIDSNVPCEWNAFKSALAPYIKNLPVDPLNNASYYYHYISGYYGPLGQWYLLTYRVENVNVPAERTDGFIKLGCDTSVMGDAIGVIELHVVAASC